MKNLKVRVYGKVQGVFFRNFIKKSAEDLGLMGWVRNERDGTVALEVEGDVKRLNKLLGLCNEGSPASNIEKIKYDFSDELQGYSVFEILFS